MQYDVFISYSWSSETHREWVRLLASHLHAIGFSVGIDADVKYGDSLNGFMRKIKDSKHVLMIVDENYSTRADNMPDSGVAIECRTIQSSIDSKPGDWVAPLLVRNPKGVLPQWILDKNLKYIDFRSHPEKGDFPGSEQILDLWRWLAGLPADRQFAENPAVIRERMARVERIDALRDPGMWTFPEMTNTGVKFKYPLAQNNSVILGFGLYEFKLEVSSHGDNSVYVYQNDSVKAVGAIPLGAKMSADAKTLCSWLIPGRMVTPRVGQSVVLLNKDGCLCLVKITNVENESTEPAYSPASITFDYQILLE